MTSCCIRVQIYLDLGGDAESHAVTGGGDSVADVAGLGAQEGAGTDADAAAVSSAVVGYARRNAASLQLRKSISIATTAANSVANLEEIADMSVTGMRESGVIHWNYNAVF